jgi:peptidoglycan/xylan/chitin deacetylase (PgdA/CDA1 family)
MHHHVSPAPGLVTVSPRHFRAQMAWLAKENYVSLTADRYANYLQGEAMPRKSVLITFDDGWLDNWLYAHPVLAEFGLHAVMFLVTARVGDGPARNEATTLDHRAAKAAIAAGRADEAMLRWSEIEAMAKAGTFEFHSHTHTHTRWDRQLPPGRGRDEALAQDLAASRATLSRRLGAATAHLCWPQGYYDDDYLRVAADAGFSHLYTVEDRATMPGDDPRRIGRQVVKDKGEFWFVSRMAVWRRPALAKLYAAMRRKSPGAGAAYCPEVASATEHPSPPSSGRGMGGREP